jgi:hypothetical protein
MFCIASNIPDFPVNPVILSKNPFFGLKTLHNPKLSKNATHSPNNSAKRVSAKAEKRV